MSLKKGPEHSFVHVTETYAAVGLVKGTACVKEALKSKLVHSKNSLVEVLRTVRLVQMGVNALVPQVNSLFPFTSSTLM